nr:hypothetical protein [Micromonospora sp. DSM 115978]
AMAGSTDAEIEAEVVAADLVVVLVDHDCLPRQLVARRARTVLDTRRWLPAQRTAVDPTDPAAADDGAVVETL